ncbi:hypothetical protein NQ317_008961, partial [Molorchus minor]
MSSSSDPDVTLFKRFKEYWPKIGQTNFKTGFQLETIKQSLQHRKSEIVDFINSFLAIQHPRDDYKEFFITFQIVFLKNIRPDQFKLTQKQQSAINDICFTFCKKAPFRDLQFCKELIKYKTIDASISKAVCGKIKNHLWYLNPENVSLSFFDENILIDDKKEM